MKDTPLYRFTGIQGDFVAKKADQDHSLYFPLCNEAGLLSAITPTLHGDIKFNQHTFLTVPVSIEDLHVSRSHRNVWIAIWPEKTKVKTPLQCWALNGQSLEQRKLGKNQDEVTVEAGLLWHKVTRRSPALGLEAVITSFVPAGGGTFEVMQVKVKNISKKKLNIQLTSAIPLYARSADNLRDHRHVTSLLHRIQKTKFGVSVSPTMTFNERGHLENSIQYYVVGQDENGNSPMGVYPTWEEWVGPKGDFDSPHALFEGKPPVTNITDHHQGKEAMGALQFSSMVLSPGKSTHVVFLLGIQMNKEKEPDALIQEFGTTKKCEAHLQETKEIWQRRGDRLQFKTGNQEFNHWMTWVKTQPTFRKIFGNSFLPDFDYGRGGRGWRDLWQDCLALLLMSPKEVRLMIVNNFQGVRTDGSNATIIGRKNRISIETENGSENYWEPEFIADRNNISRTWMDHGLWPLVTTELYVHQTGDWQILLEELPYCQIQNLDEQREKEKGTVLEHILVQHLVRFFNVGEHNCLRLEDADWNDGLDMAAERGESVAFTHFYAGNYEDLANLLEMAQDRVGWESVALCEELLLLLDRVGTKINYDSIEAKKERLSEFKSAVQNRLKGNMTTVPINSLIHDLREKAAWIKTHLNKNEWIESEGQGWFNGYYDNKGQRVEGPQKDDRVNMTLTGQVYPILSGTAKPERVEKIIRAVNEYLWDHKLEGFRLNTNFQSLQPNLGRAFSFAYGEKENGAIFSHMVVMYAFGLYKKGFVEEGYRALDSLFRLAKNSKQSRIFPGIPEYFNNEGRGRYHYLTGSASWYVYTLLTECFGVRGLCGDLVIAPKLVPAQFNESGEAEVTFPFAGAKVQLIYKNPEKVAYDTLYIANVKNEKTAVPFTRRNDKEILIQRELLAQKKDWLFFVELEAKR